MNTRFFVKADGSYIGGFAGQTPEQLAAALPAGAIEVPSAPADARDTWNGVQFVPAAPLPDQQKALRDAIDAAAADAGTSAKLKDVLTALKAVHAAGK
jgi:hypothetical protein